jgi:carboxyl-terminal processing protease
LEIERELIKIQSVKTEILGSIGYLRISTFDKHVPESVKQFIKDHKDMSGIVIDVRNNPGGLLEETVETANIFLDGGTIVSTRGRSKDNSKTFYADSGDLSNGIPLVVLINSGTASAPEIFAGALRDNKRAIIVGTRSFGKGSVQKVIPLSEKSAIRLTVAKHFTPNGDCIQAKGITPDIEADYATINRPESMFVIREEFFLNALDANKNTKHKKLSDEQNKKFLDSIGKKKDNEKEKNSQDEDFELLSRKLSIKERVEKDYQLSRAFDTIKAICSYRGICASAKNRSGNEWK